MADKLPRALRGLKIKDDLRSRSANDDNTDYTPAPYGAGIAERLAADFWAQYQNTPSTFSTVVYANLGSLQTGQFVSSASTRYYTWAAADNTQTSSVWSTVGFGDWRGFYASTNT